MTVFKKNYTISQQDFKSKFLRKTIRPEILSKLQTNFEKMILKEFSLENWKTVILRYTVCLIYLDHGTVKYGCLHGEGWLCGCLLYIYTELYMVLWKRQK